MKFVPFFDSVHQWRWRMVTTTNHRIIAVSSESYHNRADCLRAIELVKLWAPIAPIEDPLAGLGLLAKAFGSVPKR